MPQYENESQAIRNLQTYLRQLSYHDASITAPPIDGIFESDTEKALKEFQISRSIPPTGIADQLVWELLYATYRKSLAENSQSVKMDIFPQLPRNMEYGPGSTGFVVAAIQFMLRELESKYGMIDLPDITGIYDEKTIDAVRNFQKQNALQNNGLVDRATWNDIADQFNILQSKFSQD